MKSTSGFVLFQGYSLISWGIKKHKFISSSSFEEEYCVLGVFYEAIWLRRMLIGLEVPHKQPKILYCDNKGVLQLVYNQAFHECRKCIEDQCHFIEKIFSNTTFNFSFSPLSISVYMSSPSYLHVITLRYFNILSLVLLRL
jgi:hypothetical protein